MRKVFFIGTFFLVFFSYVFLIGCPIKALFNFECPFCGMTRAHIALLRLDFSTAFFHHRLFFLGVPLIVSLLLYDWIRRQHKKLFIGLVVFLIFSFLAIIINYIIKITA